MQDPIDGAKLLEELTLEMTDSQKTIITKIIQGQSIFSAYSIKDALTELDELFDSK
ncbi:MAG: hypothetical protein ACW97Z_07470 [Candidatus Hodarchaeales archaeon]|jgi:hypothetical protein